LNRPDMEREFQRLERAALKELPRAELIRSADIRYAGQSYELNVPWDAKNPAKPFHHEHRRIYGYENPEHPIEIVTIRVRAKRVVMKPKLATTVPLGSRLGKMPARKIHSSGKWNATPVIRRADVSKKQLRGPALVIDYGSTTLIPTGWRYTLDKFGSLKITL
jgi:N-methylhydantoinase A